MKTILPSLVVALLLALHAQAQDTNAAPPTAPAPPPAGGPIRVACVGDSITAGAGSNNPYPKQLQALLGSQWKVKNFGVSGRTLLKKGDAPYWKEKAFTVAHDFQPNIVVIMLGTNDTKPKNWLHEDEFEADYKALVESFKALPTQPKIFVCLPPPVFGAGNYGINESNLDVLMPIMKVVAAEEGATIIDLHAALAGHPEFEKDRVHPNADGDVILATTVAAALKGTP